MVYNPQMIPIYGFRYQNTYMRTINWQRPFEMTNKCPHVLFVRRFAG